MKYNYYSVDDLLFIQDNYKKLTDDEIGLHLNKTREAIQKKRARLGLMKSGEVRPIKNRYFTEWSKKDIRYVRDHYLTKTDKAIAEHLGKRKQDIGTLRDKLGLTKKDKIIPKYKQVKIIDYEKREKSYSEGGNFCIKKYQSMYF